jgi:hypothetical protein
MIVFMCVSVSRQSVTYSTHKLHTKEIIDNNGITQYASDHVGKFAESRDKIIA